MPRPKLKPIEYVNKVDNSLIVKISTNAIELLPEVVYIRVKLRITPSIKRNTYEKEITDIKSKFERYVKSVIENLSQYNNKQYLFNMNVSGKSIKYGKNTHLHYDIFLKTTMKEDMSIHIDRLRGITESLNQKLIKLLNHYDIVLR